MSNQPREKYTEITIKPEKIEPKEVKFIEQFIAEVETGKLPKYEKAKSPEKEQLASPIKLDLPQPQLQKSQIELELKSL